MTQQREKIIYEKRRWLILSVYMLFMIILVWRAVDLQVFNKDFLQEHGDARALRVVDIPAHRGLITDRNGDPLAVSTPVHSVWATPRTVLSSESDLSPLAKELSMSVDQLITILKDRVGRDFVYLRRHVDPDLSEKIVNLDIPGIAMEQEFKRYYPAGEVTAHLLGFTDIDDRGQEGIELAYDEWLRGTPGSKRVLQDRLGHVIENVESIKIPKPGRDLGLSIDRRIQYLAYRELKYAVNQHSARGGTLVMVDTRTGEVIAMVGQPSYNPNNRSELKGEFYRNRAVTDVFEPGSTIKPFTITAALQSGLYSPLTHIDTHPGFLKVGKHTIRDIRDYGVIDVATVIKKSSNVGASKIALSLEPSLLWDTYTKLGFGQSTGSGFPGESGGYLGMSSGWTEVELATIAFGYGISVTALQLVSAYQVLATQGIQLPISFIRIEKPPAGKQVIPADAASKILKMLTAVVTSEGTGHRAAVHGYHVAGKTGTVHKAVSGGYSEDRYLSLFAGIVPADNPRLAMVVVIDEPQGEHYYGGQVAAPVFSRVMTGALRLLDVTPDNISGDDGHVVAVKTKSARYTE